MSSPAQTIQTLISNNAVMIFSKTYCPYCDKAKSAFKGYKYGLMELDKSPNCDEFQDELKKLTGARSVPRVFLKGKFIGGGDDVTALKRNGELDKMLAEADVDKEASD